MSDWWPSWCLHVAGGAQSNARMAYSVRRRMASKTILLPLPDRGFDVTEVSVPWRLLTHAGHQVVFSTERGHTPAADPLLLRDGLFFRTLGAAPEARTYYRELEQTSDFRAPIPWAQVVPEAFDGLLLAGGHAPAMK